MKNIVSITYQVIKSNIENSSRNKKPIIPWCSTLHKRFFRRDDNAVPTVPRFQTLFLNIRSKHASFRHLLLLDLRQAGIRVQLLSEHFVCVLFLPKLGTGDHRGTYHSEMASKTITGYININKLKIFFEGFFYILPGLAPFVFPNPSYRNEDHYLSFL